MNYYGFEIGLRISRYGMITQFSLLVCIESGIPPLAFTALHLGMCLYCAQIISKIPQPRTLSHNLRVTQPRRFAHFSPNLLKSLEPSFAKLASRPLQSIDFKWLRKMTEPWKIGY
jgi:hypothetical protein